MAAADSDDSPDRHKKSHSPTGTTKNSRGEIIVHVDTSKYQNSNLTLATSKSLKRQQRYPVIIPTKYKKINQ